MFGWYNFAGMFVSERQGASFQTASVQTDQAMKAGTYALIQKP